MEAGQLVLLEAPTPRLKRKVKRGRPKKIGAGASHARRPVLSRHHPVHVVLRVAREIGNLRRRSRYLAIRDATIVTSQRESFRIVHLSVQRTHIHLLVEAADRRALSRGMQGFQISAAKGLNRTVGRRGKVFTERYHAEIIRSPRQARHTLAYVLNNWRKHAEDRDPRMARWRYDWFSSAWAFSGWAEQAGDPFVPKRPPSYAPLIVRSPQTWLLQIGWQRHGLISYCEVPSARHH